MNLYRYKINSLLLFLSYLLFLGLGVGYLCYFTDYVFFFQEKAVLFLCSFNYFIEYLSQPGGVLIYLNNLQSALYYYPFLGATIVMAEVVACVYLLRKTVLLLTHQNIYFLPFMFGALVFYLQLNYEYDAFNTIALFFQLLLFYFSIRYCSGKRAWISVIIFPLVYYLFGVFAILFLVLHSIVFFIEKDWLKLVVMWVLGTLFFFIGAEFYFYQTTQTLLFYPFESKNIGEQNTIFFMAVGLLVVLPFWARIQLKRISFLSIKKIRIAEIYPIIVLVVLALVSVSKIDTKTKRFFYAEKLFYAQEYEKLISFNSRFPSSNRLTIFTNNIALVETGKLTESLFSFRQSPDGGTLFLKWEIIGAVLRRGGYFYYTLGMINEAQRWAYEYFVMRGYTPEALKMMIKTDLIKGKYNIAEKYISILDKSIFYRDDARKFRDLLKNEEAILNHPELGKKKLLDVKKDFFVETDKPWLNLDYIIEADSSNVIALEYKLAWLMLQKDMQGVVDLLPTMEKAGYTRIPKNVEELVTAYKLMKVGELPALRRLKVSKQCERRFNNFYKIYMQNRGNKRRAQKALAKEFSATYWYYVFFN